jgi:hypothetical protein
MYIISMTKVSSNKKLSKKILYRKKLNKKITKRRKRPKRSNKKRLNKKRILKKNQKNMKGGSITELKINEERTYNIKETFTEPGEQSEPDEQSETGDRVFDDYFELMFISGYENQISVLDKTFLEYVYISCDPSTDYTEEKRLYKVKREVKTISSKDPDKISDPILWRQNKSRKHGEPISTEDNPNCIQTSINKIIPPKPNKQEPNQPYSFSDLALQQDDTITISRLSDSEQIKYKDIDIDKKFKNGYVISFTNPKLRNGATIDILIKHEGVIYINRASNDITYALVHEGLQIGSLNIDTFIERYLKAIPS